jgi:hypothetical protein
MQANDIPHNFPIKLLRSLQVLQALLGFTHFDVKAENILVVKREGATLPWSLPILVEVGTGIRF